MPLRCPRCSTVVPEGPSPRCPTCGFAQETAVPAPRPPDTTLAIVGLLLNVLVLAGLGSIVGGRTQEGIWQLVLYLGGAIMLFVGILLTLVLVGILIIPLAALAMLAGWVWGVVTGIQMVQAAQGS